MRSLAFATILVCLYSAAVPAAEPLGEVQTFERGEEIGGFLFSAFPFLREKTVEEIRSLAPLDRERASRTPNPYGGSSIHWYILEYKEGLEIQLRVVSDADIPQLMKVTVTSGRWPVFEGLSVGMSVSDFEDHLGPPTSRTGKQLVYEDEIGQALSLDISDQRVTRAKVEYYYD
jgi:hypothetical protein